MNTVNINESIKAYEAFIPFVESLKNTDGKLWITPIAENKWSIQEIIGHILIWDKYMLEEAILKIKNNQPVTVENVDIDEFNKKAVAYIKTLDKEETINQTIKYRSEIIGNLQLLPEEKFFKQYIDSSGNNFTINNFLEDFIPHDKHHKEQIEEFLKSNK